MKTMTTKRTTMKMVTRDAFRYIQLAINVPTVSTLLYIWFQSFFLPTFHIFNILWEELLPEFLSFRIIPESLRWLLSKGKVIHGSPTILANSSKVEILQGELDLLKKGSKNWRKIEKKLEMKMCSQVRRAEAVVASYLCYNSLELDPASLRCRVGIRGAKKPGSRVALLPRKFLRVRGVIACRKLGSQVSE